MKTHEKYLDEGLETAGLAEFLKKIEKNIAELKKNKKKMPQLSKEWDRLIANFNATKNDLMKDIQAMKKG